MVRLSDLAIVNFQMTKWPNRQITQCLWKGDGRPAQRVSTTE